MRANCGAGFPWLTFGAELEAEFRRRNFDENLLHTRVNLCLAILVAHSLLGHGFDGAGAASSIASPA